MLNIPEPQTIKRRVLRVLTCKLSRWDRLHVVMGCLEQMDPGQREGALLAIKNRYVGENVHYHKNPRRKQKEEATNGASTSGL